MSASERYRKLMASIPESRPDQLVSLSDDPIAWTEQSRILKGAPFSFEGRPYLHQIYRDTARETYIVKGRQTELTESLVNLMMYNAERHPGTVSLYMSNTWDMAHVFSNLRVHDMALLPSPVWQMFLPPKKDFTTVSILENGSHIYYRSAQGGYSQARSIPADFLYLDEIQDHALQYLEVATESLAHSKYKRIFGVGTGDYEDTEWYRRWHLGTQFRWDAKASAWVVEKKGDPLIHSYHVPQAIVPYISDADIERKFNLAQSRNQAIMEITGWWVAGVRKPITEAMMRACFDASLHMVDPETADMQKIRKKGPIFAGFDWGGGQRSHTVAWFAQAVDEDIPLMRLLYAGIIDDADVEAQADRAIRLVELFEPELGVMDQGGGARQVQKMEGRWAELVHKCWYSTDVQKPLNLEKLRSDNLVKANRTVSIDGVIDLLSRPHSYPKSKTPVPRYAFPAADPEKIEWIIRHFTCITSKAMRMSSGQEYVKYDKEPGDVHDALMACNYAQLAYRIWRDGRGRHAAFVGSMS